MTPMSKEEARLAIAFLQRLHTAWETDDKSWRESWRNVAVSLLRASMEPTLCGSASKKETAQNDL